MKLLLFSLLAAHPAFAQRTPAQRAPGNETILSDQLKADVYFLAGDGMRGRLTGSNEYAMAAEWIQARFQRLGLKPAGAKDSYFHRYDLVLSRLAQGNAFSVIPSGGAQRDGRLREDYYPQIFSPSAAAEGEVVFAGFGVRAPKLNWEDYAGNGLRGKIVLMLDGDPGADDPKSPFDGVVQSEHGNALRKTMAAQEHGATGVLFVSAGQGARARDSFSRAARGVWPDSPPHLERYTLATYADRIHIPVAQISPALAELLMQGAAADWKTLRARAEKPMGQLVTSGARAKLSLSVERKIVEDRNIVALIEGSDPVMKNEAVIVSGHYDHNGATSEQIFNGADDNASGAVGMLEIAEAYVLAAAQGKRPKRTVIFASWGSEERCCGPLLGAWAWVEQPEWPLDKTVAVLNMDMIGRNEEVPESGGPRFNGLKPQTAASNANSVNVIGYSYSPDLSKAVDKANGSIDLRLLRRYDNSRSNLLRRSDQWPFLQRGVPGLFIHTGLHPDYHTMNDRPERIDYKKMERIVRLVHQLSWDLANDAARPKMAADRVIPQDEGDK